MADKAARGFVAVTAELPSLSKAAACTLLQSPLPQERTLAVRWMAEHLDADLLDALIQQLLVEAKLYAKLEICQTLASGGPTATCKLLPYLGMIGYFCFEHPSVANEQVFQRIYAAYSHHADSELIQWKFVVVYSLFAKELPQAILATLEESTGHPLILQEIQRARTLAK